MSNSVATENAGRPRKIARAEAVGSLLRPPAVSAAMLNVYGEMTSPVRHLVAAAKAEELQALNRTADEEIERLVRRQIDVGLDVVNDGELRRASFLCSFYDAVEGLVESGQSREQVAHGSEEFAERTAAKINRFTDPTVAGRLRKVASPLAEEAAYLNSITDFPFKVTLPAPSYFYLHFNKLADGAYESRDAFIEDVIRIEKQLLAEAVAAGAGHVQLDFPMYPAFADGDYTANLLKDLGGTVTELFDKGLSADRRVVEDLPAQVVKGLHLCRGNFEGGFWSGSIAGVSERIFNELPYDRFLFEWEDAEQSGSYEPIKYVPKGPTMVMGLVSTKKPVVEKEDDILKRLDEAAKFLDMEQLALSPQCGFASLFGSKLVKAEDAQWGKLELIGSIAARLWG